MTDEEYVRSLRTKLESRVSASEEQTKKENQEAEIVKQEAPDDWVRLKVWLKETSDQVNRGRSEGLVHYEDGEDLNAVKIVCRLGTDRREAIVSFTSILGGRIDVRGNVNLAFECSVQGDKAVWVTERGREVCTVEAIGKKIVNGVVS
jgi:hypothetical protein